MDWTMTIGSLTFGIYDFIVFGAIIIGGVTGCAMGFSRSACKLMGYILCCPLAMLFVGPLSSFIMTKAAIPVFLSSLLSFVVLSVFIFILFRILGNLLGETFDTLGLGVVDTILGFFWGVLLAVAVVLILLQIFGLQKFIDFMPLKENSIIYTRIFCRMFPTLGNVFKGALIETL
ncbi:MAG: CvpA family protein [Spirochaetales bacterium]|nr:CvpA family protein [Candidatus Physcosoma equi]